jgi:translation initiation factor RLI1
MTISRWILLRIRNYLDKSCRENQITFYVQQLSLENRTVYEITLKNMVKPEWPQITSQYGAYALHVGKASLHQRTLMRNPMQAGTHTHTQNNN